MMHTFVRRFAAAAIAIALSTAFSFAQVTVSSAAPSPATIGMNITINGSGFSTAKPSVSLTTANSTKKYTLKVVSYNDTEIVATVKTAVAGTFDLNVKVKSATGTLASGLTITPPVVNNFTPNSAAPKDVITINGNFFGNKKPKVLIGGKSAKVLTFSNTQITCELPNLAGGVHAVSVSNKVGATDAGNITCTIPAPPLGGPDRVEGKFGTVNFKSQGSFLGATANTALNPDLIIINAGMTPGPKGKNFSLTFGYELATGNVPTTINLGSSGLVVSYTEVGIPPKTWLSALAGSTFTVNITGKTADTIEGTFSGTLAGNGIEPITITNGQFKTKVVLQ